MHAMVKHHTEYAQNMEHRLLYWLDYPIPGIDYEHTFCEKNYYYYSGVYVRDQIEAIVYQVSYRLYISLYMEELRRVHRPRAFHVYRKPLVVSSRCWWCWCSSIPIY